MHHAASSVSSYYDVLGVSPTASFSQIRTAFKLLLLATHPDKAHPGGGAQGLRDVFLAAVEAAQCLQDPRSRAEYDQRRLQRTVECVGRVSDTVPLSSMSRTACAAGGAYAAFTLDCRCGGVYEIVAVPVEEVEESARRRKYVVECDSCSLHILVVCT